MHADWAGAPPRRDLLSLDLEKAFDTVLWLNMFEVLEFGVLVLGSLVSWETLYSSPRATVMIAGFHSDSIEISRVTRQGHDCFWPSWLRHWRWPSEITRILKTLLVELGNISERYWQMISFCFSPLPSSLYPIWCSYYRILIGFQDFEWMRQSLALNVNLWPAATTYTRRFFDSVPSRGFAISGNFSYRILCLTILG